MDGVDDTIAFASPSLGTVGVVGATVLSTCLGLHTLAAGTMGHSLLNDSSLSFSASCCTFSWFLMRCNLLFCDLDNPGGDVYPRFYSCRLCWPAKRRGL